MCGKKSRFFSQLKPDLEEIRKIALKINANTIVMIMGNGEITGSYNYYLYDSGNNKIY